MKGELEPHPRKTYPFFSCNFPYPYDTTVHSPSYVFKSHFEIRFSMQSCIVPGSDGSESRDDHAKEKSCDVLGTIKIQHPSEHSTAHAVLVSNRFGFSIVIIRAGSRRSQRTRNCNHGTQRRAQSMAFSLESVNRHSLACIQEMNPNTIRQQRQQRGRMEAEEVCKVAYQKTLAARLKKVCYQHILRVPVTVKACPTSSTNTRMHQILLQWSQEQ